MKFILETIGYSYNKEDMEKLKKLGFQFEPEPPEPKSSKTEILKELGIEIDYGLPESIYFKIGEDEEEYNGSPPSIEINSLEELMSFIDKFGEKIIIDKEKNKIIIYDDAICDE